MNNYNVRWLCNYHLNPEMEHYRKLRSHPSSSIIINFFLPRTMTTVFGGDHFLLLVILTSPLMYVCPNKVVSFCKLYEWNHAVCFLFCLAFFSTKCSWDLCILPCFTIVHAFSALYSTPLCVYTIIYDGEHWVHFLLLLTPAYVYTGNRMRGSLWVYTQEWTCWVRRCCQLY